jgi:murein L,D-transpeptidase YcbB/YkuD
VPRNNIPYQLIQTSGYHNALGIIKFNFNNSESVYLHDTPNKKAFTYRNRGVSHGCIRVEKPLELAKIVLQYNSYSEDQINNVMVDLWQPAVTEKAKKYLEAKLEKEEKYKSSLPEGKPYRKYRTNPLALKKQLPIFLEYYTCFIGDKEAVQYRNDVYSKDGNILKALSHFARNKP